MKTVQRTSVRKQGTKRSAKIIQLNAFHQPYTKGTNKLINCLWSVAQAGLWPNQTFSEKEKLALKELIADHFYNGKSNKRNFKELLERICLAKRYVARKRGRYISKPQDWLNIHYPLGLAGTSAWLERVNEVRSDVPEYNKGIQTFAKAVLSIIESPGENTFHKCRKQLIAQRQFDLLQVFYTTIINLQYSL
jgi:hypothetical protein